MSNKADKQKYMEHLATAVGNAERKENNKQPYDTT